MTLIQLRYFLAVAKHQHIGKAAIELSISTSAVSHSVSALESELNCQLLSKQGRQIQLTSKGKELAQHAEELIHHANRIQNHMQNNNDQLHGHYRIAATHLYCANWLTPAWVSIQNKHPKLSAEIYSLSSHEIKMRILSGELDFGICIAPHDAPGFQQRVLIKDNLVIAYRKAHPAAKHGDSLSDILTALAPFPAAFPKASHSILNCETHPVFEQYGIKPNTCMLYDSYDIAISTVSCSDYWSLIPRSALSMSCSTLTYTPITLDHSTIDIHIIWPKNQAPNDMLSLLIGELKNGIRNVTE